MQPRHLPQARTPPAQHVMRGAPTAAGQCIPAAMSKATHGVRSSPYYPPPPPPHHQLLNWTPPQPPPTPMPYDPNLPLLAMQYRPQPQPHPLCFAPYPSTGLLWNTAVQQPLPLQGPRYPTYPGIDPHANPTYIAHDQNTNFRTYRTSVPTMTPREETAAYHFPPYPDQPALASRPMPATSVPEVEYSRTEPGGADPQPAPDRRSVYDNFNLLAQAHPQHSPQPHNAPSLPKAQMASRYTGTPMPVSKAPTLPQATAPSPPPKYASLPPERCDHIRSIPHNLQHPCAPPIAKTYAIPTTTAPPNPTPHKYISAHKPPPPSLAEALSLTAEALSFSLGTWASRMKNQGTAHTMTRETHQASYPDVTATTSTGALGHTGGPPTTQTDAHGESDQEEWTDHHPQRREPCDRPAAKSTPMVSAPTCRVLKQSYGRYNLPKAGGEGLSSYNPSSLPRPPRRDLSADTDDDASVLIYSEDTAGFVRTTAHDPSLWETLSRQQKSLTFSRPESHVPPPRRTSTTSSLRLPNREDLLSIQTYDILDTPSNSEQPMPEEMVSQDSPVPRATASPYPPQQVHDMQPNENVDEEVFDLDPSEENEPESAAPSSDDDHDNRMTGRRPALPDLPAQPEPDREDQRSPSPLDTLDPTDIWDAETQAEALQLLMTCLPRLGEPLRTRLSFAPFATIIPAQWFEISLNPIYTPHCRQFAQLVKAEAPSVLNDFLLADFNVVFRDKSATAGHFKSLLRMKYAVKASYFVGLFEENTLGEILRNARFKANRRKTWPNNLITKRTDGLGHQITYSHLQPEGTPGVAIRTDSLLGFPSHLMEPQVVIPPRMHETGQIRLPLAGRTSTSNVPPNTASPTPQTLTNSSPRPPGPPPREVVHQNTHVPSHRSSTTEQQRMRNALGPRQLSTDNQPASTGPTEPAPATVGSTEHENPRTTMTEVATADTTEQNKGPDGDQEPPPPTTATKTPYQQRKTRAEAVLREMGTFTNWEKIGGVIVHRSEATEPSEETRAKNRDMPASSNPTPMSRPDQLRQQARYAYLSKPPPDPLQTSTDMPLAGYCRPSQTLREPVPKESPSPGAHAPLEPSLSTPQSAPPKRRRESEDEGQKHSATGTNFSAECRTDPNLCTECTCLAYHSSLRQRTPSTQPAQGGPPSGNQSTSADPPAPSPGHGRTP